ncbi:hypothetical protein CI610_01055 [invertebrate metagenome]|uniref:Uncharacterized protein n=1 Tax=invertebrate metagenome TaxID=1711999 RepID=A0A2H9T9Q4_9ZZZZ
MNLTEIFGVCDVNRLMLKQVRGYCLYLLVIFFILASFFCIAGMPIELFTDKPFQFLDESNKSDELKLTYCSDNQYCRINNEKVSLWLAINSYSRIISKTGQFDDKEIARVDQVNWCELLSVVVLYLDLSLKKRSDWQQYMILSFDSDDFLLGCLKDMSFKFGSVKDVKVKSDGYLKVTIKEYNAIGELDSHHLIYFLLMKNQNAIEFKGLWVYKIASVLQDKRMIKSIQREDIPKALLQQL